jgi:hypothetical protein
MQDEKNYTVYLTQYATGCAWIGLDAFRSGIGATGIFYCPKTPN